MSRLVLSFCALTACSAAPQSAATTPQAANSEAPEPKPAVEPEAAALATPADFLTVSDSLGILGHPDSHAVPGCTYNTTVPELVGLSNKAHERTLNARLEQIALADLSSFCAGAPAQSELPDWSASRSYAMDAVRAPYVSLRFDDDFYSGGAHGGHSTACYVLDTSSGNLFSVGETLSDASLQRLSVLYNQLKRADPAIQALESTGAHSADLVVTPSSTLCVNEAGLALQTKDYELGGYAFGRPSFTLSAEQVRPLFDARLSERLFPR
jgi:hypothetical protein